MQVVKIGGVEFCNTAPLALVAGPCMMESRGHAVMMALELQKICLKVGMGFVFKTSFDKANRTSMHSRRGMDLEDAIYVFEAIGDLGIDCITDVHETHQCELIGPHVSALQIPALLSRQTDLIRAACATGLPVNIKKGQFMHPEEMHYAAEKCEHTKVLLTERGSMFGYHNLIVDMRSLVVMKATTCPVIFDCTHSVQTPASKGAASGGSRGMAQHLAMAATAVGIAGLFMEVHDDPDNAPCDGPVMQHLKDVEAILVKLMKIDEVVKQ